MSVLDTTYFYLSNQAKQERKGKANVAVLAGSDIKTLDRSNLNPSPPSFLQLPLLKEPLVKPPFP